MKHCRHATWTLYSYPDLEQSYLSHQRRGKTSVQCETRLRRYQTSWHPYKQAPATVEAKRPANIRGRPRLIQSRLGHALSRGVSIAKSPLPAASRLRNSMQLEQDEVSLIVRWNLKCSDKTSSSGEKSSLPRRLVTS